MNRKWKTEDEQELVAMIAGGDKKAFRVLYEQTYGKVFHYIKGFVRNNELAEDVVVQTYTIVWQKASNYRGTGKPTTWIIGIARNIALKEFRKNKPHAVFDEHYMSEEIEDHRTNETLDRKEKLQQAMAGLSPKHREILELVFFQDLTYPEVSVIIDIPVGTVKTRVYHAKIALKQELEKRKISNNDI